MLEAEQRCLDILGTRNECDRFVVNWIEHEVPWSKLHNKKESNLKPNKNRTDAHDNLLEASMKPLMEHSMEESGDH